MFKSEAQVQGKMMTLRAEFSLSDDVLIFACKLEFMMSDKSSWTGYALLVLRRGLTFIKEPFRHEMLMLWRKTQTFWQANKSQK
jgi:hypothetical protein